MNNLPTPSIRHVARAIVEVKHHIFKHISNNQEFDIRLQVYDTGEFAIRFGDSQYDLDHRGRWTSGTLTRRQNCRILARQLIKDLE